MVSINNLEKNITLDEFLVKCKIPGIGPETARKIAIRVKNIQTLRNLIEEGQCKEALTGVYGISNKNIDNIIEVLTDIDFMLLLEDMEEEDFDMFHQQYTEVIEVDDLDAVVMAETDIYDELPMDLTGINVCITGTLSLPRRMFQNMIVKNGGKFQTAVTNATDILIYSETDGMSTAKYKMAEKLKKSGCKLAMVTEKMFIDKFTTKI